MEQAQFGQVGGMSGAAQTPGGAVWQFRSGQGWARGAAHQAGVHAA